MTHSKQPAVLTQAGPAGLGLVTEPSFELAPHIELINREIVEAIAAAEQRRSATPEILLVAIPPRHGKSMLISTLAPAWYLGAFPDRQVMLASYEADFAAGWGSRVRDLLAEHGHLYGVRVDPASRAARRWKLEGAGGGMISAGVGGAITGRGAHLLIIDDPIKNAEQAMSEVIRERQWDWWLSTARSRLEPGAVVVVLMTRWHEGDLGGRMLSESAGTGGDPVREIRLPALAEEADPLRRERGAPLWPGRYGREALEKTRSVVGPYWWSAMYQGRPSPDDGGIFDRRDFRYFDLRDGIAHFDRADGTFGAADPNSCRKATFVDLAVSTKETADYTVALKVWIGPDGELLIVDVARARIPGPAQVDYLEKNFIGTMKVEAIGYQSALIQALARRGLPVEPVYPDKDKVTRASAAGALYRSGRIYHLRNAKWLHDLESELLAFPAGDHDDQVDALAYAARDLPNLQAPRQHRRGSHEGARPLSANLMTEQL